MKDLIKQISFIASAINLIVVEHPADFHKCIAFILFVIMAYLWIGSTKQGRNMIKYLCDND